MRVVHVNTFDVNGGAARAAHRLHSGLRSAGCESMMYVARRTEDDPYVTAFNPPIDVRSRLGRLLRRERIKRRMAPYAEWRRMAHAPFSDDQTQYGPQAIRQLPSCEIVNLHWIRNFVDIYASLRYLTVPIVWTLHDVNPFTGGCHVNMDCDRYTSSCGMCPQLGSMYKDDLSRRIWKRKHYAYRQIEDYLHVVAPSTWMAAQVARSTLLGGIPVSVIPHGLDTNIFLPRNSLKARDALGIPQDVFVLLFIADVIHDPNKGFSILADCIKGLSNNDRIYIISVGKGVPCLNGQVRHRHLGYVDNDYTLSEVYSAADLLVTPSFQESFGQTTLESMACGTPVVGFDVGGLKDLIRNNVTGLRASVGSVRDLRDAITCLSKDVAKCAKMAALCRKVVLEEYTVEVQAARYLELYRGLLGKDVSRGRSAMPAIAPAMP